MAQQIKEHLQENYSKDIDGEGRISVQVQKGHVILLNLQNRKATHYAITTRKLQQSSDFAMVTPDALKSAVIRIVQVFNSLKKNVQRNWDLIMEFFKETLTCSLSVTPTLAVNRPQSIPMVVSDLSERAVTPSNGKLPTPKKLRSDCGKCVHRRISIKKLCKAQRSLAYLFMNIFNSLYILLTDV